MVCNVCGMAIKPGSKFCEGCGKDVSTIKGASPLTLEEKYKETIKLIPMLLLSIVSVTLSVNFRFPSELTPIIIHMLLSCVGFILGMIAISQALKSRRPLVPIAITIIILASIAICFNGIAVMVHLGRFIKILAV